MRALKEENEPIAHQLAIDVLSSKSNRVTSMGHTSTVEQTLHAQKEDARVGLRFRVSDSLRLSAEALVEALHENPSTEVRMKSAESLGLVAPTLQELGAVALARCIREELDDGVREQAAWALVKLGPAAGEVRAETLVQVLKQNSWTVDLRWAIAHALGELGPMGGMAAGEVLAEVLECDGDPKLRRTSAHAIGLLKGFAGKEAVGALRAALRQDGDEHVRQQAAWALGNNDFKAVGEMELAALVGALCGDGSASVRYAAASALETLGDPVVPYLASSLDNLSECEARAVEGILGVLESLATSHFRAVASQSNSLLQCLVHHQGNPSVSAAVTAVCLALGPEIQCALPALTKLARNAEGDTEQLVAQATAVHILECLFEDPRCSTVFSTPEGVRATAVVTLHKSRDPSKFNEHGRDLNRSGIRHKIGFLKGPARQHREMLAMMESPVKEGTTSFRLTSHP